MPARQSLAAIDNNCRANSQRITSSESCKSNKHVEPIEQVKIVPGLHTRLRSFRHIVGFRTYNLAVTTCGTTWDACIRVRRLLCSTNETLTQAVTALSHEIDQLRILEDRFYKECDRIMFYERKAQELKFWKENIEDCIKDSMHAVRSLFNETEHNVTPSENYQRIQQILDENWTGHSRYLDTLYEVLWALSKTCTRYGPQNESCEQISCHIDQLETEIEGFCSASTRHRMAYAQEYVLFFDSEYANFLVPTEQSLRDSFVRKHNAAEYLFDLLRETQDAARIIQGNIELIRMDNVEGISSQMLEEERILLEFIDTGREHERRERQLQHQQQQQQVLFDADQAAASVERQRKSRHAHQFDTKWSAANLVETPVSSAASSSPVWTRSWAGQIRIHK